MYFEKILDSKKFSQERGEKVIFPILLLQLQPLVKDIFLSHKQREMRLGHHDRFNFIKKNNALCATERYGSQLHIFYITQTK